MGKWAALGYTVRISGFHGTVNYYKSRLQTVLEKEFGPVEEVIISSELGDIASFFADAFAIFKETLGAKNAVAARTITIGNQTVSFTEPSSIECSKIGIWRKSRATYGARPSEASRPPRPNNAPRSLPYGDAPYSRIHQSPIRSVSTTSPRTVAMSILPTLLIPPGKSISSKSSPLLRPGAASSLAEARQLPLGPQSHSATQSSNQADPATTNVSHKEPAVTTGIAGQVTTSAGTEPSQQDLNRPSAAMTTSSVHLSGAVEPSPVPITAAMRTGPPSCASQKVAPVTTDVGRSAPTSAPVSPTFIGSSRPQTGASTTPMLSKPVLSSSPLNAIVAPKTQVDPPSDPAVGAAPVSASSVPIGSHSSLPNAMQPSAVAFVTVQGDIPSQNDPMRFAFQSQSQTGAQALNSTSCLQGGVGFLGSNFALSSGIAHVNQFSNFQQPPSGNPTMAGRPSAPTFPPPNAPASMQQQFPYSTYQNPLGPVPRLPLVATPVHPHPQSASRQQWIGDGQATLGYSIPVTQLTSLNPTCGRFLSVPADSSVNQGESKAVSFTQEQFLAAQAKFKELRKEHEEAMDARSKAIEELESERERSKELIRRLEDAEKIIEQMKRQQETSGIQHRAELDCAQKANTEKMKTIIQEVNEEWALKLRGNEERLLREAEQAKRRVSEERELSSTRERELRSGLQVLEVQSDWKSKLEAVEEERLKLQEELMDLNQEFLRADGDAQVELSRQQELERQLDDSWARERTRPEIVKAFTLLEGMARKVEAPCDVRVAGSSGHVTTRNPVKAEDSPQRPVRVGAKRQRLL